jgi:hypothetical protein
MVRKLVELPKFLVFRFHFLLTTVRFIHISIFAF